MDIQYKNQITPAAYNAIRQAMGWRQFHPHQAQANIDGNTLTIAGYHGDVAIAMAGLRYNGGSMAVLNLLIRPEYQHNGIEKELMAQVFAYLQTQLQPGHSIQLDTFAPAGQEEGYQAMGFQVSTPEMRGIPMHICLSDQIAMTDQMFRQMGY